MHHLLHSLVLPSEPNHRRCDCIVVLYISIEKARLHAVDTDGGTQVLPASASSAVSRLAAEVSLIAHSQTEICQLKYTRIALWYATSAPFRTSIIGDSTVIEENWITCRNARVRDRRWVTAIIIDANLLPVSCLKLRWAAPPNLGQQQIRRVCRFDHVSSCRGAAGAFLYN